MRHRHCLNPDPEEKRDKSEFLLRRETLHDAHPDPVWFGQNNDFRTQVVVDAKDLPALLATNNPRVRLIAGIRRARVCV